VLEYSYDMPLEKSTYSVKTRNNWARVAYSGTLLFDSEKSDLLKLTMRISELPVATSTCEVSNEITYRRISIHDRLALIPRGARLQVLSTSGTESLGEMLFANCREYKSKSRLLPDIAATQNKVQRVTPAPSPTPVPAGLAFNARIITPIDSETAAAGDPIEAVLRSTLHGKNKAVIAPAGARIGGRITSVRWVSKPELTHQISLRFESIEVDGRAVPFSAVLERPHAKVLTGTFTSMWEMPPKPADPYLGGTFSFHQEHLRLKSLDARWITVRHGHDQDE
jgi:hypothetical protein